MPLCMYVYTQIHNVLVRIFIGWQDSSGLFIYIYVARYSRKIENVFSIACLTRHNYNGNTNKLLLLLLFIYLFILLWLFFQIKRHENNHKKRKEKERSIWRSYRFLNSKKLIIFVIQNIKEVDLSAKATLVMSFTRN